MSSGEPMSSIREHSDDAAAYVLGALEPNEAARFREHLETCAACREEVAALGQVVDALPIAAPQHPVPRRLRRRVLRAVREDAKGPSGAAPLRQRDRNASWTTSSARVREPEIR